VLGWGVYAVAAAASGAPLDTKYGPLVYIGLPIGPAIMLDAWRKLQRWPCLVIAELGFDDRMGDKPSGPVLWREVASMRPGRSLHVTSQGAAALPSFTIQLRPGRRQPLSPLGGSPKHLSEVTLELATGPERRILELMEAEFQAWQEREKQAAAWQPPASS
jgi:hypothetical protein